MTKRNNSISFVIVNYNSADVLNTCLYDLQKIKDASTFEIIIINNDKTALALPTNNFASQKIIEINNNIGYGSACNIGLNLATNKFICFLNPDTHSFCDNLSTITTHITDKKTIISPQIRTQDKQPEKWSTGSDITLLQTIKNNLGIYKKPWLSKDTTTVDWVSGAAMFGQTQFIRELNGFDEDFFLYFEDIDLCKRTQKCGGTIKYIPQFHLTHTNGVSSDGHIQKQKKCYYKSQDLFFKKHLGATNTYLMRICRLFHIK